MKAAPAALYVATVRHARHQVLDRAFAHRVYYWLVDLDRLPALPRWLRPFARFDPADHLGDPNRSDPNRSDPNRSDPNRSIRQNLDAYLATQGVDLRGGRVLMLANARVLGHVFNPITVYWCHDPDGAPACVVAEVHNTYRQRHCYLLRPDAAGRARVAKRFYVSPFLTVEGHYRMSLPEPGARLALAVTLHQHGRPALAATLVGERRPATPATLVRLLLRHPLVTRRTSALIRRHGAALWLRRLPVIPRPTHAPQEGV